MYLTSLHSELKDAGYVAAFVVYDNAVSYEFSEAHIFLKDDRVFSLADSGCSCYGWGDNYVSANDAIGNMVELPTLESARKLILEYVNSTDSEYHNYVEDFRKIGLR